jgi:hypothetical protein
MKRIKGCKSPDVIVHGQTHAKVDHRRITEMYNTYSRSVKIQRAYSSVNYIGSSMYFEALI